MLRSASDSTEWFIEKNSIGAQPATFSMSLYMRPVWHKNKTQPEKTSQIETCVKLLLLFPLKQKSGILHKGKSIYKEYVDILFTFVCFHAWKNLRKWLCSNVASLAWQIMIARKVARKIYWNFFGSNGLIYVSFCFAGFCVLLYEVIREYRKYVVINWIFCSLGKCRLGNKSGQVT